MKVMKMLRLPAYRMRGKCRRKLAIRRWRRMRPTASHVRWKLHLDRIQIKRFGTVPRINKPRASAR